MAERDVSNNLSIYMVEFVSLTDDDDDDYVDEKLMITWFNWIQ